MPMNVQLLKPLAVREGSGALYHFIASWHANNDEELCADQLQVLSEKLLSCPTRLAHGYLKKL